MDRMVPAAALSKAPRPAQRLSRRDACQYCIVHEEYPPKERRKLRFTRPGTQFLALPRLSNACTASTSFRFRHHWNR
jgi:hypothetical protein